MRRRTRTAPEAVDAVEPKFAERQVFPAVIAYLCIPLYIFLFTFLNLWLTAVSAVLLIVLLCCVWRTAERQATPLPQPLVRYWPLLIVVAGLVYAGIWSPFDYTDWQKHFAIFNLLIDHAWPPHPELRGQEYFLRYGLGWYLVPALSAQVLGAAALTPTMYVWTVLGTCLALLLGLQEMRRWQHLLLATLVFFCFSGLDLVGAQFVEKLSREPLSPHWLQWWVGWGQIAPNLFGITWVPQHALPAWLGACLVFAQRRLAVQYGAVLLAAIALWSPFAAIGLLPFYLYALCKEGWRAALTLPNLVLAPPLLVPLLLYFSSDAGNIPLTLATSQASPLSLVLFALLEFGIATLFILSCDPRTNKGLLFTSFLSLAVLISLRFGELNDLLMRGSIAAVSVLALLSSRALLRKCSSPLARFNKCLLIIYLAVVVALVSSVDPRRPRSAKHHRFTDDSSLAVEPWRTQYLARPDASTKLYLRARRTQLQVPP